MNYYECMKILIALFFSLNAFASVEHKDFNFDIKLTPNGKYEVNIHMLFDSDMKFSEIITNLYLNEQLKQQVDENFVSQEVEFYSNSENKNTQNYKLDMKVKKIGVTAHLKSKCNAFISRSTATNNCILISSSAFLIGSLFKHGKNNLKCSILDNRSKKCIMTLKGQTLPIGGLIGRTADRLALSGSTEAVSKTFFLYHKMINLTANAITEDIYEDNILNLWNQMMLKLDNSDRLQKSLKFQSSQNGLIIK